MAQSLPSVTAMVTTRNTRYPEKEYSLVFLGRPGGKSPFSTRVFIWDTNSSINGYFEIYQTVTLDSEYEVTYNAYLLASGPNHALVNGRSIVFNNQTSDVVRPASPGFLLDEGDVINVGDSFEYTIKFEEPYKRRAQWRDDQGLQYTTVIHKDFELLNRSLGEGASTQAILAYDRKTNEQVVCKIIDLTIYPKHVIDRTRKSLELMVRCNHPNVTWLRRGYSSKATVWMFEDLAGGGDLEGAIRSGIDRISWPKVVHMVRQILKGVAYIHKQGVVHRDIKPNNILCAVGYNKGHRLAITDFNLAVTEEELTPEPGKSNPWGTGTPGYESPEMMCQGKVHGKPTDMWSFGVTVAELLTHGDNGLEPLYEYPRKCSGDDEPEGTGHEASDNTIGSTEANLRFFRNFLRRMEAHGVPDITHRQINKHFPPITGDDFYATKEQALHYIEYVIHQITEDDPTDPTDEKNRQVLVNTVNSILEERYEEFPSAWFGIVEGLLLTHFLRGVLTRDPAKRTTAEEALQHPWLTLTRGQFFYLDLIQKPSVGRFILGSPKSSNRGEPWPLGTSPFRLGQHFWFLLTHGEISRLDRLMQGSDPILTTLAERLPDDNKSWATLTENHYRKVDLCMDAEMEWRNAQNDGSPVLCNLPDLTDPPGLSDPPGLPRPPDLQVEEK